MLSELRCPNCDAAIKHETRAAVAVCQFCDSEFIRENAEAAAPTAEEQTIFARWDDGYYYPAVIAENLGSQMRVAFLDGDVSMVEKGNILELEEGLNILQMQGNWQYGGLFYKGVISGRRPMIMNYNDGYTEVIELKQLRGAIPGERPKKLFGLF